ncbi:MAG TPA: DMT family transporter [Alphaproteobacteria bacterium]
MSKLSNRASAPRGGDAETGASRAQAYPLLIGLVVIWGLNWPIVKSGLIDIGPLWLGATRLALGAACLFALVALRGRLRVPGRPDLLIVANVGLMQMCAFMVLLNVALQFVDAGRAVIVAYTTPLWVAPAAVLLLGERMTPRMVVGCLLGLSGILVLFNPASFDWTDRSVVLGNGLLMLAAVIWAVLILHVRVHKWHLGPLDLAPWQALVALVPTAIIALLFEDFGQIQWTDRAIAVIAYNGVLATGFGVWAMVSVSRVLPAISSSLGFLGAPVVGYLSSAWLLGEPITTTLTVGLALIVGGVFLVLTANASRTKTSA